MGHTRINTNPAMTRQLVEGLGVFKNDPMVICDVGARGGLEAQWQVFGSQACLIGFEPDAKECDRLRRNEVHRLQNSSDVANYHIYPVALGKQQEQRLFSVCRYPGGSSFYPADLEFIRRFPQEYADELTVVQTLEIATISLDEFVRDYNIPAIDFLKLDVEGSELDILQGAREVLQSSVLGLSLEVLFHASMRHQPTFSEIDQFLQGLGFQLFDLDIYRHARRTLPRPMGTFGNTDIGQVMWGQALYLRDGVAQIKQSNLSDRLEWNQTRILKLASLMEIFSLPDCALELIQSSTALLNLDHQPLIAQLTPADMHTQSSPQPLTLASFLPKPRGYAQRHNFLSPEELQNIAQTITTSPYLAESQLSTNFQGSRGFSVIFTRAGIERVQEHFPSFTPYLQQALKSGCNAFYLNPLLLTEGMGVEPHVDCSISSYGMVMTIPRLVSVLYVQVPAEMTGGELVLKQDNRLVGAIVPQTNTLVHFLGNLLHSVNPVKCSQPRISLICEQYNLSPERLQHIPEFEIKSGAKKYEEIAHD